MAPWTRARAQALFRIRGQRCFCTSKLAHIGTKMPTRADTVTKSKITEIERERGGRNTKGFPSKSEVRSAVLTNRPRRKAVVSKFEQ